MNGSQQNRTIAAAAIMMALGVACAPISKEVDSSTANSSNLQLGQLPDTELKTYVAHLIVDSLQGRVGQLAVQPSETQIAKIEPAGEYYADYIARAFSGKPDCDASVEQFRTDLNNRLNEVIANGDGTLPMLFDQLRFGTDQAVDVAQSPEKFVNGMAASATLSGIAFVGAKLGYINANDSVVKAMKEFSSSLGETVTDAAVKSNFRALVKSHPMVVDALKSMNNGSIGADDAAKVITGVQEEISRIFNSGEVKVARNVTAEEFKTAAYRSNLKGAGRFSRGYGNVFFVAGAVGAGAAVFELIVLAQDHFAWSPSSVNGMVLENGRLREPRQERLPKH